jgi:protein TonB
MTEAATGRRACFATLGIAPTSDVRAIKRAYAAVLKTIDLAVDPDRFARLRADYEMALQQAPHIREAPASTPPAVASDTPAASPASPEIIPAPAGWHLGDTSPRRRLKNAPRLLADIDNRTGWAAATPVARMPPVLSPPRGRIPPVPRYGEDDDGESEAIAALLDDRVPDRPRLLDAGLRRYGWDMVGTDLRGFGAYQGWLTHLLEERARWQAIAPRQRKKPEAMLARIAAAPPSGSVGDMYRWSLFAETVKSFPLWTAFVAGSYRLDEWSAAAVQAPAWKRWAVGARHRPLRSLFLIWILTTFLSVALSDVASAQAALALTTLFGLIQLILLILMAATIGQSIARRLSPKSG